jgi:hypothetical protein
VAYDKGSFDNITAVVIYFPWKNNNSNIVSITSDNNNNNNNSNNNNDTAYVDMFS